MTTVTIAGAISTPELTINKLLSSTPPNKPRAGRHWQQMSSYWRRTLNSDRQLTTEEISWGPLSAVLLTLAGALFGALCYALIVGIFQGPKDLQTGSLPLNWWTFVIIGCGSLALPILFVVHRAGSLAAAIWQLGLRPVALRTAAPLLGLALLVVLFIQALGALSAPSEQQLTETISQLASPLLFISIVLIVPLYEEILFRGFLFAGLRKKFNFLPAALISAIIFAVMHFEGQLGNIIGLALVIIASALILSWLYEKSNSLWPSIALHATINALGFLAAIA